jgi:hypothetical protein
MELPVKFVGMSGDDYRSHNDFFSRSYLSAVYKHGARAQQWMDLGHQLVPQTNSLTVGTRFDRVVEGIIQGRSIDDMIFTPPAEVLTKQGHRRGKAYDEWKSNQNGIVVSADDEFQLRSMVESLMAHKAARDLVEMSTETQVSVFFEIDGHRVKVRPDGCLPTMWWDLKSTSSTWDRIYNSAADYGYYEQEWLYVKGAMAIGLEWHRMPFVFTQTMPPYATEVMYLPEELVEIAGERMKEAMEVASLRISTGVYTPDEYSIQEMKVPTWARRAYIEG